MGNLHYSAEWISCHYDGEPNPPDYEKKKKNGDLLLVLLSRGWNKLLNVSMIASRYADGLCSNTCIYGTFEPVLCWETIRNSGQRKTLNRDSHMVNCLTFTMPINRSYGDFRETPKPLDFEGYDFGMANRWRHACTRHDLDVSMHRPGAWLMTSRSKFPDYRSDREIFLKHW